MLLEATRWLNSINQPLWTESDVSWDNLSKRFNYDDFYIAYCNEEPAGCIAVIDYDPEIWPEIEKGNSLFLHYVVVSRSFAKHGVADELLEFSKQLAHIRKIPIRLDCNRFRKKLRDLYESHGWVYVGKKYFKEKVYHSALYIYDIENKKKLLEE